MTKEDYKEEWRKKTIEAAAALIDDLKHFRKIINSDLVTAGDIRRLSAQLRRFLVDGALEKVAGPRVGRIRIPAPASQKFRDANAAMKIPFLGLANVRIFGVNIASAMLDVGDGLIDRGIEFDPNARIDLSVDDFMRQGVIILDGDWITRRDVIRYIANVADGVHSGDIKDDRERLIKRARHAMAVKVKGETPTIIANIAALATDDLPLNADPNKVDWVLIELLAAACFVCEAPDIIALEAFISNELA